MSVRRFLERTPGRLRVAVWEAEVVSCGYYGARMTELLTSWCDGPLVALDLETTGRDPCRDRMVSAAVVTISRGMPRETTTWLADPGVDIPAEATEIHGITSERARREGRPADEVVIEVSALLAEVWVAGIPLCAFNAAFDLTVLDAELQRYRGRRLLLGGPVIDPLH